MNMVDGPIFVLGSSGFAREVRAYFKDAKSAEVIFVDDTNVGAIKIAEYHKTVEVAANNHNKTYTILGSGKPSIKKKMCGDARGEFISVIHPKAWVQSDCKLGRGNVIAPGAIVANEAKIGWHVLINYSSTLGHDSIVGDFSAIGPNAAVGGWCTVGEGAYIGSGACIREKLHVGNWAIVAMGAVVTRDVPDNWIAVGNPAKIMSIDEWTVLKSKKGWLT